MSVIEQSRAKLKSERTEMELEKTIEESMNETLES